MLAPLSTAWVCYVVSLPGVARRCGRGLSRVLWLVSHSPAGRIGGPSPVGTGTRPTALQPEWPFVGSIRGFGDGVAQDLLYQFGDPLGDDLGRLAAAVSGLHDEHAGQPVEGRSVAVVPGVRASPRITTGRKSRRRAQRVERGGRGCAAVHAGCRRILIARRRTSSCQPATLAPGRPATRTCGSQAARDGDPSVGRRRPSSGRHEDSPRMRSCQLAE